MASLLRAEEVVVLYEDLDALKSSGNLFSHVW